jgi:hypothetical protein
VEKLSFVGGAYSARSVIASAQRCVNYYPEINPKDAAFGLTCYQRPGLRALLYGGIGSWRGLWQSSQGTGFGVCGNTVYRILPPPNWGLQAIGLITSGIETPCSMTDNGQEALLVDGTVDGWTFSPVDGSGFHQVVDGTGTFLGADRVDTLDTYILWNWPGTIYYGSTLSGVLSFDPLYFAGKASYPDPLQTLIVNRRQLILPGLVKTEDWYNAGNANFPFAEQPGTYIEHGIAAKYSIACSDISTFFIGKDLQSTGMAVYRIRGYETKVISNPAISYALRVMQNSVGIDDAIGYCYCQDGHWFYVLQFPKGDQTWVFDDSIGVAESAWHQRAWTDADGQLHRERNNCSANIYGYQLTGDHSNGTLYLMDPDYYQDQLTVGGTPGPISFIRGFAPVLAGMLPGYPQPLPSHARTVLHRAFWASIEAGTDPRPATPSSDLQSLLQLSLRWSDDWGKSWGNAVLQSAGELGEYRTLPQWAGLGLSRFRVYELYHSIPGPVAINGAWVDGLIQELNR